MHVYSITFRKLQGLVESVPKVFSLLPTDVWLSQWYACFHCTFRKVWRWVQGSLRSGFWSKFVSLLDYMNKGKVFIIQQGLKWRRLTRKLISLHGRFWMEDDVGNIRRYCIANSLLWNNFPEYLKLCRVILFCVGYSMYHQVSLWIDMARKCMMNCRKNYFHIIFMISYQPGYFICITHYESHPSCSSQHVKWSIVQ